MEPTPQKIKPLVLEAPAKINWFLEILRKRDDGFHEIETLMQKIAWSDRITFAPKDSGTLTLTCSDSTIPTDHTNLVMKAVRVLEAQTSRRFDLDIQLEKHLPHGAGLGSGSSDAATTLCALNDLYSLGLNTPQLSALGAQIGSDVPFFLEGPLALCCGRGEIVKNQLGAKIMHLVVVWPGQGASTVKVYKSDLIDLTSPRVKCNFSYDFEANGNSPSASRKALFNRLSTPCEKLFAFVAHALEKAREICGKRSVALSGSGASFFVVCDDENSAQDLAAKLKASFPAPAIVKVTHTLA